jgi:hypothetical protein
MGELEQMPLWEVYADLFAVVMRERKWVLETFAEHIWKFAEHKYPRCKCKPRTLEAYSSDPARSSSRLPKKQTRAALKEFLLAQLKGLELTGEYAPHLRALAASTESAPILNATVASSTANVTHRESNTVSLDDLVKVLQESFQRLQTLPSISDAQTEQILNKEPIKGEDSAHKNLYENARLKFVEQKRSAAASLFEKYTSLRLRHAKSLFKKRTDFAADMGGAYTLAILSRGQKGKLRLAGKIMSAIDNMERYGDRYSSSVLQTTLGFLYRTLADKAPARLKPKYLYGSVDVYGRALRFFSMRDHYWEWEVAAFNMARSMDDLIALESDKIARKLVLATLAIYRKISERSKGDVRDAAQISFCSAVLELFRRDWSLTRKTDHSKRLRKIELLFQRRLKVLSRKKSSDYWLDSQTLLSRVALFQGVNLLLSSRKRKKLECAKPFFKKAQGILERALPFLSAKTGAHTKNFLQRSLKEVNGFCDRCDTSAIYG